jgi:hypothetical protein
MLLARADVRVRAAPDRSGEIKVAGPRADVSGTDCQGGCSLSGAGPEPAKPGRRRLEFVAERPVPWARAQQRLCRGRRLVPCRQSSNLRRAEGFSPMPSRQADPSACRRSGDERAVVAVHDTSTTHSGQPVMSRTGSRSSASPPGRRRSPSRSSSAGSRTSDRTAPCRARRTE